MTHEEALYRVKGYLTDIIPAEDYSEVEEIIKALEQQPCDDAISRQAVLDLVNSDWKYEGLETDVASLPSVTPQPKTGRWVKNDWTPICSCCGKYKYEDIDGSIYDDVWFPNYCPNCGAKMQESE